MTKEEIFEMFDRYDAYETLDTGETVQVIHWHDLKHIAEELVKNCSIPVVVGQSERVYTVNEIIDVLETSEDADEHAKWFDKYGR